MKFPPVPWRSFRPSFTSVRKTLRLVALLLLLGLAAYAYYLDVTIREAFDGRKFALPARVYGRALEMYPGVKLTPAQFVDELRAIGSRENPVPDVPGTYRYTLKGVEFTTRDFAFWDGQQPGQRLRVEFADGKVSLLQERGTMDREMPLLRIEPPLIGGIYPGHNEDRALLKLAQVPKPLIDALIATEDRKYYSHWGIDPRGIARALYKTLSGQRIEGGSTITQQLVKNFFLTSERTLTRKANEVLMALLLEVHYSKDEILETYLNEVYLGQDATRAIHGVGLASHFYFDRPIERLQLHEVALLVGMVKGPSVYDPRGKPERALHRRNVVLQEMVKLNAITQEQFTQARQQPLGVVPQAAMGTSPYPAFLQYVQRQLQRDYREEDLRSEGLRIFTTLDPNTQRHAEQALTQRLAQIEKTRKIPANTLEGAVIVSSTQTGEVQAMVGGRQARFAGFNRAIDARRQIGSLAKPIVFLTALETPNKYTLVTPLDDSQLIWRQRGSPDWKPQNYDLKFNDQVPLHTALAKSLNVATARLGIELGVERILDKLPRFGIERRPAPFPSSLLGAYELSPIEVTQMYQTFADGGFRTPLRAIRDIVTADGKPLQRFPLTVVSVAPAGPVYLLTTALQGVVRDGTAQQLSNWVAPEINAAGKTGTTDELRDSWFAGYTGDLVAVVWVGRDDNKSSGLTGSSGAMTVWGEMMKSIQPQPLQPVVPEDIEIVSIEPLSGKRTTEDCMGALRLPFIKASAPAELTECTSAPVAAPQAGSAPGEPAGAKPEGKPDDERKNWFQRLMN